MRLAYRTVEELSGGISPSASCEQEVEAHRINHEVSCPNTEEAGELKEEPMAEDSASAASRPSFWRAWNRWAASFESAKCQHRARHHRLRCESGEPKTGECSQAKACRNCRKGTEPGDRSRQSDEEKSSRDPANA